MKNLENPIVTEGYSLTILTGESAFHELKDEWEELWSKSPDATQFQRWEWQYLYYKHITPNAPLKIYVVRDSLAECVALAPFCRLRDQYSGLFKVAFVGDLLADYHMILCKSGLPLLIGFQILNIVFKKSEWCASYVDLSNILQDSWTHVVMSAYFRNEFHSHDLLIQKETQTYSVSLPDKLEIYLQNLGSRSRKDFAYDRRRLEREYVVEWRMFASEENLEQCLDAVESVNRARWRQESSYRDPSRRDFLISLARAQAKAGIYLAFVLYLNGLPASYVSGTVVRNSYKVESTSHDPDIARHLSVGKTMNFYAIEDCIRRGFLEYDLTRGSESYKLWLGAEPRNSIHARLYRSRMDRALAQMSEMALNLLRRQIWLRRLYQRFVRGVV